MIELHNIYLYISENIPLPGGGNYGRGKKLKGKKKEGQKREKGKGKKKGGKKRKKGKGEEKKGAKKGKGGRKKEKGRRGRERAPRTHPKWLGPSGLGDVSALLAPRKLGEKMGSC